MIPSMAWNEPNALLVDREYQGLKSKAEYGLNLSKKNLPLLEDYLFSLTADELACVSK